MGRVYRFSQSVTDGRGDMRDILGGKGAGLAEMCRLGVPVPPGFTISTEACIEYLDKGGELDQYLQDEVTHAIDWLEEMLDKSIRGQTGKLPLLLSVRSGARTSMPGMMDTILNLGLNNETVAALAEQGGDRRFAYDSYRRFIQMYGNVVLDLDHADFEDALEATREEEGVSEDWQISAEGLSRLVVRFKEMVAQETGQPFPEDPFQQLWGAIRAVFSSWNNPRAKFYRKIHHIDDHWGTAVTIQSMVFGNMGEDSGTGVCFSRNAATGEQAPYGEYLINAQGEDVVAGIRTPHKINDADDPSSMISKLPGLYNQLVATLELLERHFQEMQDTEFTFEKGKLWLLQTRTGKRTSQAGLKIAIDMCKEGLIDERTAIMRIEPGSMSQLLASEFDQDAKRRFIEAGKLLGTGLNAGPGAATGIIALDADLAATWAKEGKPVVLVRAETSPEDIEGMHSSRGILTQRGGMTSHAAVVARGMGKPCVVGCAQMSVDLKKRSISFDDRSLQEGDFISIDGTTGEVIKGRLPTEGSTLIRQLEEGDTSPGTQGEQFALLMSWVAKNTRMSVRANADNPQDARIARLLGAAGIGLCRTEHMFFGEDRILHMRKMILSTTDEERDAALGALLPFQRDDFLALFKTMDGLPVTVRLLDPPLHEFLPNKPELIAELADSMSLSVEAIRVRIQALHESNPMLGHRGCRLGISFPAIYAMQVKAIVAAVLLAREAGIDARPEIMVPLIATKAELEAVKAFVAPICEQAGLSLPIGTMIEIPRAALTAGQIVAAADFFSFGTNDLTQCGLGLSRDDSGSFLPLYLERGILARDPFKSLDQDGIGQLVAMAVQSGRQTKPNFKMGVCGEHGGDPDSIAFFERTGLDYVSCSPFRVPVALLAAAQAFNQGGAI